MSAPVSTILLVIPWSLEHVGGVNQVVTSLAREIQRVGHWRPVVLIGDWAAKTPAWGEFEGIPTVRWQLRGIAPNLQGPRRWLDRWRCARFQRQFRRFCNEQRVTAINCHYLSDTAYALAPALPASVPLIVSVHGTDVTTASAAATPRSRARELLQACHAVVAPSRNMAERTRDELGLNRLPTVIYNSLDATAFRAQAAGPNQSVADTQADQRTLLAVGKFEHQKGQDVLLRAFASLVCLHPDLRLQLIGARADALDSLKSLAEQLGVGERVQFFTDLPHDQLARHYRGKTIFVLPSRQESFGIVLLEAGALGVPVVATRVGGIPEIVTNGETGLLVPPDDVEALTQALARTLDEPDAARARALRLQRRVETDFSWQHAYRQYAALFSQKPA